MKMHNLTAVTPVPQDIAAFRQEFFEHVAAKNSRKAFPTSILPENSLGKFYKPMTTRILTIAAQMSTLLNEATEIEKISQTRLLTAQECARYGMIDGLFNGFSNLFADVVEDSSFKTIGKSQL